jgi:3-oxoacyl-[acyl-carrier-protein] synthase II
MIYVKTASSISHQDSFQKPSIWELLQPLQADSVVIAPEYKNYIPPAALRRLSPVLRMAMTVAQECQSVVGDEFDSISVGTALGCLKDTEKFLETFLTAASETLSPTAFIQSTHNTIGGQISLALGNHAYNMTHTQNSLSFEVALIDAMICCRDGKKNVLVGAADEAIDFLEILRADLIQTNRQFTSGASFFVIGSEKTEVQVADCWISYNAADLSTEIASFLTKSGLNPSDIDLLLHSGIQVDLFEKSMNYQDFSGFHYSSSAFAFHIGHDFLKSKSGKNVFIVNAQMNHKLGLILLRK